MSSSASSSSMMKDVRETLVRADYGVSSIFSGGGRRFVDVVRGCQEAGVEGAPAGERKVEVSFKAGEALLSPEFVLSKLQMVKERLKARRSVGGRPREEIMVMVVEERQEVSGLHDREDEWRTQFEYEEECYAAVSNSHFHVQTCPVGEIEPNMPQLDGLSVDKKKGPRKYEQRENYVLVNRRINLSGGQTGGYARDEIMRGEVEGMNIALNSTQRYDRKAVWDHQSLHLMKTKDGHGLEKQQRGSSSSKVNTHSDPRQ